MPSSVLAAGTSPASRMAPAPRPHQDASSGNHMQPNSCFPVPKAPLIPFWKKQARRTDPAPKHRKSQWAHLGGKVQGVLTHPWPVQDKPRPPRVAGAGEGHCDLCYFPETRENSGIMICPHAGVCVRARNRTRKILALISVLIILGQDALTKCGSKIWWGRERAARSGSRKVCVV